MMVRMSESDLQAQIEEFQRCIEQRDAEGANAVLVDDYALVLVQPTPAVMPRDRWRELLPDYVVRTYVLEERRIDVSEDCARRHSTPLAAGRMPGA